MIDFFYAETKRIDGKNMVRLWTKDGQKEVDALISPYCFEAGKGGYKDATSHLPLMKKEFDSESDMYEYCRVGRQWESDVPFMRRIMLDNDWQIGTVPKAYVDIEVNDREGIPDASKHEILCIGIIYEDGREEYLVGDEKKMLSDFIFKMQNIGMIITYNGGTDIWQTRAFDLPYISKRYEVLIGKRFEFDKMLRHCAFIDLYQIYKYEMGRVGMSLAGGYSLDNVANYELGHGKIKRNVKCADMSAEDLKAYNLQDVRVLKELDEKFTFTDLKVGLARLTNLCMVTWRKNKKWDELKPLIMVEQLILKESAKSKLCWRDRGYGISDDSITGALVTEPKIGLHKGVLNVDVKQMYPSIMINERYSPDKGRKIFPTILIELKKMRAELKARYNESGLREDYIKQYNYKVLANIFYGAVANASCRVYDRSIAQAITVKGREIVTKMNEVVEDMGLVRLYNDTDSVYVMVDKSKSDSIVKLINTQIAPYEVEAGEYYVAMFFGGNEQGGIKKRYAGLEENGNVKIVGMEAIKRDSTVLVREMQSLMLDKILHGVSVDECKKCVRNLRQQLHTGVYDQYLVITKGVKDLKDYKMRKRKDGSVVKQLPHIRALQMAVDAGHQNTYDISFVYVTGEGQVKPVLDGIPPDIDYAHYYKQVEAVLNPLFDALDIQAGRYVKKSKVRKTAEMMQSMDSFVSS